MTHAPSQKGFTLVELAIVMTIIGLLIGGILKGQELMQNARLTATIAQVRAYEAATTTFRDKYDSLPGDMANASQRIPNCANCDPLAASAGNGIVGRGDYANAWTTQTQSMPLPATNARHETTLFWAHLLMSDLITGVTNTAVTTADTTPAWGTTHPGARVGGGFIVGHGNGSLTPGQPAGSGPNGMVLLLTQTPTISGKGNMATGSNAAGGQPLLATQAAQIDRKMDDGRPDSGYVYGYGVPASCFGNATPYTYIESTTTKDCGVIFRIQG